MPSTRIPWAREMQASAHMAKKPWKYGQYSSMDTLSLPLHLNSHIWPVPMVLESTFFEAVRTLSFNRVLGGKGWLMLNEGMPKHT